MSLSLDWETRSRINLPATGAYVYAMHPSTEILIGAWAFDDMDAPEIWRKGEPVPQRIIDHVAAGGEIRAHNAAFERLMWKYVATPRYGWPEVKLEQFVCSAAEAAAMSLPRALGQLAKVLGVEAQKDQSGHRLMMQMCKPRKVNDDDSVIWWDDEERMQKLITYCKQDVVTERAVSKVLRKLTPREREVYLLTERMNDRGVQIDLDLVRAAQIVAQLGIDEANVELRLVTGGSVAEVTKVAQIKNWLIEQGVIAPGASLNKAAVAELLDEDIPETARAVLELRSGAGRSSVAKLVTMQTTACEDGRCRGMSLYHGAGTGRWTGKLIQPHNFPRGEIKNIENYIPLMLQGDYHKIGLMDPPIMVVMSMLRSMITARPGHELVSADFAAIEARVLNWLAQQDDVVDLFRQYDAASKGDKMKFDPYRNMAVKMGRAKRPEDVSFIDRQAGKAAELGCGFQMGWEKFIDAAWKVYQVRVDADESKSAVKIYRASHGNVTDYWERCNAAAIDVVTNPGKVVTVNGNVKFVKAGPYLYIMLPSGRPLAYPAPKIVDRETPWKEMRPAVEFSGVHPLTGQWTRMSLYGGLITENIVQAVARDLLAEGKLRLEAAGYLPILSVHDEAIAEVPVGFGTVEEYESILSALPEWATGCPVAAEGWRGFRYRK